MRKPTLVAVKGPGVGCSCVLNIEGHLITLTGTKEGLEAILSLIFRGSSMVEQGAVNSEVAGSSPAPGV